MTKPHPHDLLTRLDEREAAIGIIGLGYVGLPLALEFARHFDVVGFDINEARVAMMRQGIDPSEELEASAFADRTIEFTTDPSALGRCAFYVVAVPTDITEGKVPNLTPLQKSSETVAKTIAQGDYVVYESTVYPGCTEEVCLPIIESKTGLRRGTDFKYGYSPERINPGDKERTVATILKIVSGCDEEATGQIASIYERVITAGVYRAESVKVAEAAKVIENTQRDLNISLMNELAIVFDRLGIDTEAVLEAAGTKWNFIPLRPGLVGGHCIGVDPYYLLHKAREVDIEPEVIAAGRRVNDRMPSWIAKKIVKALTRQDKRPSDARALILGVTFKEDVSDTRNSKVVDLVRELEEYRIQVDVADPHADVERVAEEYGVRIGSPQGPYDVVVGAVGHRAYREMTRESFDALAHADALVFDLKGLFKWGRELGERYWKL